MKIELANCEQTIDKRIKKIDIAKIYVLSLKSSEKIKLGLVNNAIN